MFQVKNPSAGSVDGSSTQGSRTKSFSFSFIPFPIASSFLLRTPFHCSFSPPRLFRTNGAFSEGSIQETPKASKKRKRTPSMDQSHQPFGDHDQMMTSEIEPRVEEDLGLENGMEKEKEGLPTLIRAKSTVIRTIVLIL